MKPAKAKATKAKKTTKTKSYATDSEVLEELASRRSIGRHRLIQRRECYVRGELRIKTASREHYTRGFVNLRSDVLL